MKNNSTRITLLLALLIGKFSIAQRFVTEVFTNSQITITNDVQYGQNFTVEPTVLAALTGGTPTPPALSSLFMDVYAPSSSADTMANRPLIVYIPTGNFLPPGYNGSPVGDRKDSSAVNIAKQLARRGYVCAVIDYRKGWNPIAPDQVVRTGTILTAAYRGQQDSKAAVRYFRADRANANVYKIDANKVALLGEGTGSYIALAHAYLDKPWKIGRLPGLGDNKFLKSENPDVSVIDTLFVGNFDGTNSIQFDPTVFAQTGDLTLLKGNIANNPDYPSNVQLVINMGGALGDTSWMDPGQVPLIGIHAVRDFNAPYQIGDVIVPTTGDLVIPFASGAGLNLTMANTYNNNASFANKIYTDPITQAIEARYNTSVLFNGVPISVGAGKGLLPFILPGAAQPQFNHGSPWQFWSATQPTASFPVNTPLGQITTHQASCLSNPYMAQSDEVGRNTALTYIDTVQRFINPRVVCALGLSECDLYETLGFENANPSSNLVRIFPNPASELFSIAASKGTIISYQVIDITGKTVRTQNGIKQNTVQVSTDGLASGMYLVRFETTEGTGTTNLILE